MKKFSILPLFLALLLLQGCGAGTPPSVDEAAVSPVQESSAYSSDITEVSEAETVPSPAEEAPAPVLGVEPVFSSNGRGREYIGSCFCSIALGEAEDASLHKWEKDIVCFSGSLCTEYDLDILNSFCTTAASIEGLPSFTLAEAQKDANIVLNFCSRAELLSVFGEAAAYEEMDSGVKLDIADNGSIDRAEIYIRTDVFDYERERLILKELMRSLGLMYDLQIDSGSIFSSGVFALNRPSELDFLMLKLLYNNNLSCGMGRSTCLEIVQALVK